MATSRFQNLRAALATAISSRLTTDGVTGVTVGQYPPLGDYSRTDRVFLTEISSIQEPFTQGPSGTRMEELEVGFVIQAPTFGGTVEEHSSGEARAEQILGSVETAVRTDITVSSTVFNIELSSFTSSIAHIDEYGPYGYVEGTLTAEAHI